ncbi:MAG: tRNA lysidine(34) synthetase TilS, partial [Clostridia bacterium]|nr:tRNA lysidine(34) synthetase TilS [Clostridia bacterium]
ANFFVLCYNKAMNVDITPYQNKKICIALSGGGDSVALLHYFRARAAANGIALSAVHCEHGIRGEASKADYRFVTELCAMWGVPLYQFSADCKKLAEEQKVSLETAARNFRYGCFEELLQSGKTDCIATAHHQGDNAETVLFHICRGASLTGASGIHERGGYIRPFLSVSKTEISRYLQENNLQYCTDQTNFDEKITRNALRLRVLPLLEEIVPGAMACISRFSSLAEEDDAFLYALAEKLLLPVTDGVGVVFCPDKPIFRRACLLALKKLGVEKDYTLTHLELLFALQSLQNGDALSMPDGVEAVREYDRVVFYRPQKKDEEEIAFGLGNFTLAGVSFRVEGCKSRLTDGYRYIDVNKIPATAVFRTRREGDVFQKFGGGSKKLKNYLIDKKIPVRERDKLVLLADGKEILAIIGGEISEKVKVEENSAVARIITNENNL